MEDLLSIDEMKSYLKDHNQSVPKDVAAHEVQEMFEICKIVEG